MWYLIEDFFEPNFAEQLLAEAGSSGAWKPAKGAVYRPKQGS